MTNYGGCDVLIWREGIESNKNNERTCSGSLIAGDSIFF